MRECKRLANHSEDSPANKFFEALTDEESYALELATFLMRSGRIDESSHSYGERFDQHHFARSFEIFDAIAKDLKISEETCEWIKLILNTAGVPIDVVRNEREKNDVYEQFCGQID